MMGKSRFALYFGTRDVFPGQLVTAARREVTQALEEAGHEVLLLKESATRDGAVETRAEGEIYARFLREHEGRYDGVILVLPNFGDENGALAALAEVDVPILILAYPDRLSEMGPGRRRDAFCGKLSIMDVFGQAGIRFTALKPHTVAPGTAAFQANIDYFDRVCRVVRGLRRMRVGAIGARVTHFKTVRIDEIALQDHGITVETYDLSMVFERMQHVDAGTVAEKIAAIEAFTDFNGVPAPAQEKLARLGVVIDAIIREDALDAVALRCWFEIQAQLNISPCVLLSELNHRRIAAACEVDIGNAVAMHALQLAGDQPAACLDWNNNYEEEEDKCILFHCGPVPPELMAERGRVTDHGLIAAVLGEGKSYGCNVGRLAPGPFTFGSLLTRAGRVCCFLGEGEFTQDPIPDDFFGCAGVAHITHLQEVLLHVGRKGHRHHVSVTPGWVAGPLREAWERYLGYEVTFPQGTR